jgi:hypothetical protein
MSGWKGFDRWTCSAHSFWGRGKEGIRVRVLVSVLALSWSSFLLVLGFFFISRPFPSRSGLACCAAPSLLSLLFPSSDPPCRIRPASDSISLLPLSSSLPTPLSLLLFWVSILSFFFLFFFFYAYTTTILLPSYTLLSHDLIPPRVFCFSLNLQSLLPADPTATSFSEMESLVFYWL